MFGFVNPAVYAARGMDRIISFTDWGGWRGLPGRGAASVSDRRCARLGPLQACESGVRVPSEPRSRSSNTERDGPRVHSHEYGR
jgi:hypothetical protein